MWQNGLLKPTVFHGEYRGLESVVVAMKDLSARRVWGKAVVLMDAESNRPRL
jgi:NADPH2:quinone reductase